MLRQQPVPMYSCLILFCVPGCGCLCLRCRSAKLFQKQVAPVLEDAAGMMLSRVVTQHAGHASELTRQLSLAAVDMLVFVGGDGTVFEGLQVGGKDSSCAGKAR